jgi:hypothetical protein
MKNYTALMINEYEQGDDEANNYLSTISPVHP